MHDIKAIRENPDAYVAGWLSRGVAEADGLVADILRLDAELRRAQTTGQDALAKRNAASKLIGAAMGRKGAPSMARWKAFSSSACVSRSAASMARLRPRAKTRPNTMS